MSQNKKTDNHNPKVKLDLRRHMLRKYHADGCDVLDCCNGSGVMWGRLREEFIVRSLVGIDVKPKNGRLRGDSARLLDQPGWTQDVIDVDTYGSPWEHWAAILRHLDRPRTVFLTWGIVSAGGGSGLPNVVREAVGLPENWVIPASMTNTICAVAAPYLLTPCRRRSYNSRSGGSVVGWQRPLSGRQAGTNKNGPPCWNRTGRNTPSW